MLTDPMGIVVADPPPPASRRAAVKPRAVRTNEPAPEGRLAIAPPPPSEPAEAPATRSIEIPSPKPTPIRFRSMVTTAQDWPLVRPPVPPSPTFGIPRAEGARISLHSLPAFSPPPELVDKAAMERLSLGFDDEIVKSRRAMQRRVRWMTLMFMCALCAFVSAFLVLWFMR
jgi:hypothetical protein